MKKLKKYSGLFIVFCCCLYSMYGMNKCYGLVTATIPQTSKGILGNFRLDKGYGLRDYLAQYIAFDKQKTLNNARWQDRNSTEIAYNQFLNHNSATAILYALNNNIIDKDYALNALYFTHKVARRFQEHIEYHQDFAHKYSGDPEQYVWVDNDAFSPERKQLLKKVKQEQAAVIKLVDFLQQRPLNKEYPVESYESVFKKEESSRGTIQDYLKKYIARNLHIPEKEIAQEATFLDIKKAFESFVHHNNPDTIARDFEDGIITRQHAKDALEFTFWVIRALENYLADFNKDDSYEMELFELFWHIERMKEKGYDMKFMENDEWNSHIRE